MNVSILPSAIVDIVRMRCFYDNIEYGLGIRFQDYIFGEIACAALVNVANMEVLPITNTNSQLGTGNIGTGYWQHWQQLPPPEPEIAAHLFKLYADNVRRVR